MAGRMRSAGAFLGGYGRAMEEQRKRDFDEETKDRERTLKIVEHGLDQGWFANEQEAFDFLMSSGKGGKKGKKGVEMPPAMRAIIQSGAFNYFPRNAQGTPVSQDFTGTAGSPSGPVTTNTQGTPVWKSTVPAQTASPSAMPPLPPGAPPDPARWNGQLSPETIRSISISPRPTPPVSNTPSPDSYPGSPQALAGTDPRVNPSPRVTADRPAAEALDRSAPPETPLPPGWGQGQPVPPGMMISVSSPATSPGSRSGLQLLSPEERLERGIEFEGRQYQGKIGAQIDMARRLVSMGVVGSVEDGLAMLGLQPRINSAFEGRAIGTPIRAREGMLDPEGRPIDPATTEYVQGMLFHGKVRYMPSGPRGAGGMGTLGQMLQAQEMMNSDDPEVRAAGELYLRRIQNQAQGSALINQGREIDLGNIGTWVDRLPLEQVGMLPTGPDPDAQQKFEQVLTTGPHAPQGRKLMDIIKGLTDYSRLSTSLSTRRVEGLTRADYINYAQMYDPTYNSAEEVQRQRLQNDWRSGGRTATSGMMASAKTLVGHMTRLKKASDDIETISQSEWKDLFGGILNPLVVGGEQYASAPPDWAKTAPWWLKPVIPEKFAGTREQGLRAQQAQKIINEFNTARMLVANEFRRYFAGASGGGLEELLQWQKVFSPYSTKVAREATINQAAHLMFDQIKSKVDQYIATIGRVPEPGLWMSDLDRRQLTQAGISLEGLPDASGEMTQTAPAPAAPQVPGQAPAPVAPAAPTAPPQAPPQAQAPNPPPAPAQIPAQARALQPGQSWTDPTTGTIWRRSAQGQLERSR